jgi:glycosyltransferase involved in cell wall biosynthesis
MQFDFSTILFYTFLLVAGIQVLYWLFFLVGLFRIGNIRKDDTAPTEGISIIVAARNEIENLKQIIPALLKQDHQDYEVIIVNDRSDDGSDEFLIEEEQKFSKLKILHIYDLPDHISAKKYALTLGIKAASNKHVLLTDADCLPSSDSWVSSMAGGFANGKEIVLGFSSYNKLSGFLNYFIRFETLLTGIKLINYPIWGSDEIWPIKKICFWKIRVFLAIRKQLAETMMFLLTSIAIVEIQD